MREMAFPMMIVAVLVGLVVLGGTVMVWQAWVASPELAPAQVQLLGLADWTVKGAVGALLGFAGGERGLRFTGMKGMDRMGGCYRGSSFSRRRAMSSRPRAMLWGLSQFS